MQGCARKYIRMKKTTPIKVFSGKMCEFKGPYR